MPRMAMPAWVRNDLARLAAGRVGVVHLLPARGSQEHRLRDAHQHWSPTVQTCLAGTLRLSHAGGHIDLDADQAVVIVPGAWHEHAPLLPGCRGWSQGLRPDGSDAILGNGDQGWMALAPAEVTTGILTALAVEGSAEARRRGVAALAAAVLAADCFIQAISTAQKAMAVALWRNIHRPVGAREILATSSLSERQAHRQFLAYYGETPKQALLTRRLWLAERLLVEGMGVAEAARACGFPSRAALTRLWRLAHGTPPRTRDRG